MVVVDPTVERRFFAGSVVEVAVLVGLARVVVVEVVPAVALEVVVEGRADVVVLLRPPAARLAAAAVPVVEVVVARGLLGELVEEGAMVEVRREAVLEVVDFLVSSSEADTLGRER